MSKLIELACPDTGWLQPVPQLDGVVTTIRQQPEYIHWDVTWNKVFNTAGKIIHLAYRQGFNRPQWGRRESADVITWHDRTGAPLRSIVFAGALATMVGDPAERQVEVPPQVIETFHGDRWGADRERTFTRVYEDGRLVRVAYASVHWNASPHMLVQEVAPGGCSGDYASCFIDYGTNAIVPTIANKLTGIAYEAYSPMLIEWYLANGSIVLPSIVDAVSME